MTSKGKGRCPRLRASLRAMRLQSFLPAWQRTWGLGQGWNSPSAQACPPAPSTVLVPSAIPNKHPGTPPDLCPPRSPPPPPTPATRPWYGSDQHPNTLFFFCCSSQPNAGAGSTFSPLHNISYSFFFFNSEKRVQTPK